MPDNWKGHDKANEPSRKARNEQHEHDSAPRDHDRKIMPDKREARAQTHKVHHTIAATSEMEARKFLASLSYRVAMRRKSLSRQKAFSIR